MDLREQLQSTLGDTYAVERELGGGGMSRVFVADETRLKRKVVVKVLPPELAQGLSAERFEREIQVAASLQQANIVPVLSVGETDGLPYFTMPFVDGESLRVRLARGPLPVTEIVSILRDVARALAYAHERGVVHRDIKPDNVLLSRGTAVVTDFGIAKAIAAAATMPRGATLTQVGTAIGTPTYMAPEQAAGDPATDHRADFYAFGCMAYELLIGRPPFEAQTPQALLAAHMAQAAPSPRDSRPETPAELTEIVARCMAKDPAQRFQDADELLSALESTPTSGDSYSAMPSILVGGRGAMNKALVMYAIAFIATALLAKAAIVGIGLPDWVFPGALIVMALGFPVILITGYTQHVVHRAMTAPTRVVHVGSKHGAMASLALKASPHLSWSKTAKGGIVAIAAFVVVISAFMLLRAAGVGPFGSLVAAGKLENKEPIVVAEFATTGSDSTLGSIVAEAVRADLAQSPVVTLLSQQRIAGALQRMQRPAGSRLDSALARDMATRLGSKAVIDGSVRPLGAGYLVTLRLIRTDSADVLASFTETADTPKELIPAIGKLTRKLRSRIGESLKHVQQSPRLEEVTTSSLAALGKFSLGTVAATRAEYSRAVALFDEATAIDTAFASAYRSKAILLSNLGGDRERQFQAVTKAYQHRERLPEIERYLAEAAFFGNGPKVNPRKAVDAYERLLLIQPNHATALNNASVQLYDLRELERAEEFLRRAAVSDSTRGLYVANLFRTQMRRGRRAAAESTLHRWSARAPSDPFAGQMHYDLLIISGQLDSARQIAAGIATRTTDPSLRANLQQSMAYTELARGRVREGLQTIRQAARASAERGARAAALQPGLMTAFAEAWYFGRRESAAAKLDSALTASPLASIPPLDRPHFEAGMAAAQAGRIDQAKSMASALESNATGEYIEQQRLHILRSFIAAAERQYDVAIREARAADVGRCNECALPVIALMYDLAGQPDSAVVAFERYLADQTTYMRDYVDAIYLAGTYKRLGELWEQKGDAKKAASYYAKFVELWKNADPELQPKVTEVRGRLARLAAAEKR
jgi:eukaryotic-like serine/threonine-protein kinase